jgi:hypothetical protein
MGGAVENFKHPFYPSLELQLHCEAIVIQQQQVWLLEKIIGNYICIWGRKIITYKF